MKLKKMDATHILEWALALEQAGIQELQEEGCPLCSDLTMRLKKFIGKKATKELYAFIIKHPYFPATK